MFFTHIVNMSDTASIPVSPYNSELPVLNPNTGTPVISGVAEVIATPNPGMDLPANKETSPQIAKTVLESPAKKDSTMLDPDVDELEDDASVLVIILQCETKSCDINIANLKWAFSDPYFIVQVCAVDPPSSLSATKTLTQAQYLENYNMRKALSYAAEGPYAPNSDGIVEPQFWWNKKPVIIIKDSSITNLTPAGFGDEDMEEVIIGGLKRRIKTALNKASQADLFFLCKWNDACDKFVDVDGANGIGHGSSLKWSTQPTATQAIMYNAASRDYVRESLHQANIPLSDFLNLEIAQGNLLATVFVPNIIDFDIDLATSNDDYAKLNECAPVQGATGGTANLATLIWLIFIVIVVVLVAWTLIQLTPQYAVVTPS